MGELRKTALITGVTGQDGAYLAEFLLKKGYVVHGIKRRSSSINTQRINHLNPNLHEKNKCFYLHNGDITDSANIMRIIQETEPNEIYNLAAQSHVQVSFESPEYTANADALGTLRILEAIRVLKMEKNVRFYQASTSELYGKILEIPQNEHTPFYPRNPYAVSKLYSYWITVNYREAYGFHANNGILFNHESPIRGENFVTRKITRSAARLKYDLQDILYLGNLNAKRDWGFAGDYVKAMWLMLQQEKPGDFVVATGKAHSVRDFCELAFKEAGFQLRWEGHDVDEVGVDIKTGKILIRIDPVLFRPAEVDYLLGDATKAHQVLNWKPKVEFNDLVKMMVKSDLLEAEHEALCMDEGYTYNGCRKANLYSA